MILKKVPLSQQIFLSMIGLMSFALFVIAIINIQQIRQETMNYNAERLARKDRAVAKSIESIINLSSEKTVDLKKIFQPTLKDVGHIHKLKINIYNLKGEFVWSSDTTLLEDSTITGSISNNTIDSCHSSLNKKIEYEKGTYFGTYRILYKSTNKIGLASPEPVITNTPFCILDVIYDKSTKKEVSIKTNQQIRNLIKIYIILFVFSGFFAYFLLKQITSPLRSISAHLASTKIDSITKPLHWPVNDEIGHLINDYNKLMKELEKRTQQLIKSEKEGAWKKMAKQIAHEIKNPLTPMRLNVQYLLKSFNDGAGVGLYSDEWKEKLSEFSKTMIQQIDTLTRIANIFSDFASIGHQSEEKFNIQEELEKIVYLFKNNNVKFQTNLKRTESLGVFIDKSHLNRALTNLIKNSLQAARTNTPIEVLVELKSNEQHFSVSVKDNGTGIPKNIENKIFEPNFTTKNSGMGLGLAIVKKIITDFQGDINYQTSSEGTVFTFTIPRNKPHKTINYI